MKVAVIYNKPEVHPSDVIDLFGPQTKERYNFASAWTRCGVSYSAGTVRSTLYFW